MKYRAIILLLIVNSCALFAQQKPYKLKIYESDKKLLKTMEGKSDSIKFQKIINTQYHKLVKKGFILSTISTSKLDSSFQSKIIRGKRYYWGHFNINMVPEELLSRVGYQRKQFTNTRVNPKLLGNLMTKIIIESDKSGYPFATAQLDSVYVTKNVIYGVLNYKSGPLIKYADLTVNTFFVKSKYLESYLGIKSGDLFNSNKISDINKKIKKLSYCKTEAVPHIKFENKTCKIFLKLAPIKTNKIDAMLGLATNQVDKTKLLVTGYVNVDLHNLFRSGKQLSFNWRKFDVQSQKLKTFYHHTKLFGSAINVKGQFDLLKQDTSFINTKFYFNIGYDNADYIVNITSDFITSRLLSPTTSSTSQFNNLNLISFNTQYYGLEFLKQELDNPINQLKGWSVFAGMRLGSKTIVHTSYVPAKIYKNLKKTYLQGSFVLTSKFAVPISKILVAYSKLQFGILSSKNALFSNELFRLGGLNSIRGFNELEIYASKYVMLQFENRLLLGENARLFGFLDWAYTNNEVLNYKENFLGLGAGMLLNTPSGIIQLVYAVGKSSKQSLSLKNSKIHIGYVALF